MLTLGNEFTELLAIIEKIDPRSFDARFNIANIWALM
jgi:hypothetical protein